MSLAPDQLKSHCETIIRSPRIKNKIVVLCEGDITNIKDRPSPQSYGKMEKMPDANFYKACVPSWWQQNRPQFFNCGDRKDVLDTYFTLLKLHAEDSTNSYLSPEKLFAIVDLDLQVQTIENYSFSDTEAIFCHLYDKSKVNETNAKSHNIWVTGLIHKEAYFLIPELQPIFDNFSISPIYNGNHLELENIYITMADKIGSDSDLQYNLERAVSRISYCSDLDCSGIDKLQDSWKDQFQNVNDETQKNELILALLTIKKAKDYCNEIKPASDWTRPVEAFRDQLSLEIGRFYSEQSNDVRYHISFFLTTLYNKFYRHW